MLYTPIFEFLYPLEALFLCTPRWAMLTICTLCWDVLRLVPIAGTCYGLYPLLVHGTGCTHCWDMLRFVPITGTCYRLYPLLIRAIACTHYWYVLRVAPITSMCYRLYPLLRYAYYLHPLLGCATVCIHKHLLLTSFLVVVGNFCSWPISRSCT